mmetsp:Transcript_4092/g.6341  ORF Transcript_4092/g.6341 Transcript_4092/m.6341 type:complete len:373 (-) Transcript_4092:227-1345(-)|eukprot:CAMPEP_0185019472 /NCGR_PEP_ID=MMETSP1103-20130426/2080_1 /TAXON_ID=36769 /ORGANISM="Paraphysomonas bandaiensis, Strain Caron Lab Isolate" /LENGTH=372 /DNA_ID=CAMNT_0027549801 /DNA_START=37 /DNA_END=1155 /DNA_ORIENTATION=-
MNTLTAIEAERVVQILRLASDRIHILSYLPTAWDDAIYSETDNPAVRTALEKQWKAEEALRRSADIASSEMGGKDIALLKRVHKCTRNTCRNLMEERQALQSIMDRPESSRDSMANFIRYLNELKTHVQQKLTTTVEDEAANRTQLHDLGEKERQTEESRDALQAKLNEVREEKEKVTFGLDQALRKLQFELHDLTHLNKVETEAVNREMAEAISKATADHELRMKQLTDQVEGLERQLAEVMDRNKEEEQRLRKDKSRAEVALSSRITQYDEDMLSRQETISSLEADLEGEEKEYAVLKEYFDKVDADLNRQSEEEEIIDAVVRRQDFAMGIMIRAAVRIQSCIRARLARVEVEKVRAKAKKGKKGKKGKK